MSVPVCVPVPRKACHTVARQVVDDEMMLILIDHDALPDADDADADDTVSDDADEHRWQASSGASVSSEACDQVPSRGQEGSKKGEHSSLVTTSHNFLCFVQFLSFSKFVLKLLFEFCFHFSSSKVCAPAPLVGHPHHGHHTKPVHGK